MKVIGITGGVGAGKSTVLEYLSRQYSARIVKADEVAHGLQKPGLKCYYDIAELLGSQIISGDGTIDRKKMADKIFNNHQLLKKVNSIIHPAVKAEIIKIIGTEREAGRYRYVVIEAALLLEDNYDKICDEIWYVHADEKIRSVRLKESRGYDDKKIMNIMNKQMKEKEFRSRCSLIIDNSSSELEKTYRQIDEGIRKYEIM